MSFCLPGVPLAAEDLNFSFVELGKSQLAADFASLANTVPPARGYWVPSDRKVDAYYKRVLNETIRPVLQLNDTEKKRLAAARSVVTQLADIPNPTTGVMSKVPADTPLYQAYQERMTDYLNALTNFKSLQANYLQRPNDAQAQAEWFTKSAVLKQKVKLAFDRWVAGGKNQVDQALSTIRELGRGTGERWDSMKDNLRLSEQTTSEGSPYLFTKFFPSQFWDEAHTNSWTKFSMAHEEVHTVDNSSSTSWGGGGFGLWSFSASASYAEQRQYHKSDANMEKIDVELIRVPIRRSWWDTTVFWDRGWKFDPQVTNMALSDGRIPPAGEMTAYPTAMIVSRNLNLAMNLSTEENSHVATQFSASGSVGWGPWSLKGNYSKNTDSKTHDFSQTSAGLECKGMQIIGFVCELLPKSPDTDPTLNWQAYAPWPPSVAYSLSPPSRRR